MVDFDDRLVETVQRIEVAEPSVECLRGVLDELDVADFAPRVGRLGDSQDFVGLLQPGLFVKIERVLPFPGLGEGLAEAALQPVLGGGELVLRHLRPDLRSLQPRPKRFSVENRDARPELDAADPKF